MHCTVQGGPTEFDTRNWSIVYAACEISFYFYHAIFQTVQVRAKEMSPCLKIPALVLPGNFAIAMPANQPISYSKPCKLTDKMYSVNMYRARRQDVAQEKEIN